MNDCRSYERLITEVVSGVASEDDRLRLERHRVECEECRKEFDRQSSLMDTIVGAPRPDPGDEFWDRYFDRLANRMEDAGAGIAGAGLSLGSNSVPDRAAISSSSATDPKSGHMARWMAWLADTLAPTPAWSVQLAAAIVLVALGIAIGRVSPAGNIRTVPSVEETGPGAVDASLAALDRRVHHYIGRARTLLLGLVNFDPAAESTAALDIPTRRTVARELVQQAGLLRTDLAEADQRQLSELVADLEVILIQLANLEENAQRPAIEIIQSSVDQGAILFKIDVEEMRRAERLGSDSGTGGSEDPADDPAI